MPTVTAPYGGRRSKIKQAPNRWWNNKHRYKIWRLFQGRSRKNKGRSSLLWALFLKTNIIAQTKSNTVASAIHIPICNLTLIVSAKLKKKKAWEKFFHFFIVICNTYFSHLKPLLYLLKPPESVLKTFCMYNPCKSMTSTIQVHDALGIVYNTIFNLCSMYRKDHKFLALWKQKHLEQIISIKQEISQGLSSNAHTRGLFIWAQSTRLARFPRSHLATLFVTKISMWTYEKAGWPSYRDLWNRAENFSHMNTPARIPGLSVTKHFQLRMAYKVTNKSEQRTVQVKT